MKAEYKMNKVQILLTSTLKKLVKELLFTRLFSTHILVYWLNDAVRAMCLPCYLLRCMASLLVTREIWFADVFVAVWTWSLRFPSRFCCHDAYLRWVTSRKTSGRCLEDIRKTSGIREAEPHHMPGVAWNIVNAQTCTQEAIYIDICPIHYLLYYLPTRDSKISTGDVVYVSSI